MGWKRPEHYNPTPDDVDADRKAVVAAGFLLPNDEEEEDLGMGWSKVWHPEYNCHFYRNEASHRVQWETPDELMPEPGGSHTKTDEKFRFRV